MTPERTATPRAAVRARRRLLAAAAGGALFLGSALALVAGVFTPHATQPPLAYPIQAPNTGNCQDCHGIETTLPGYESLPHNLWSGSMMANAARDPLFWAALDVANHDLPGIGDFCLRCHAPTGWYAGRSEPPGGTTDGCGLLGPIDLPDTPSVRNDFEGLSCHFCHRAMVNPAPPPGELPFYRENGKVWLDDTDCGGQGEPCRRGPYDFPPGGDPPPPHPWAYSPYHRSADLCAACHNVTNPVKNLLLEDGTDTGIKYPIERTHQEWAASDFAPTGATPATCQQCHMPQAPGPGPNYACIFGDTDRTGELARHEFVGGNAWIPEVLKGEYGGPLQLDREQRFDDTIAWTQELLHQAAEVALAVPAEAAAGQPVAAGVRVTNLSGHKLPTGYPEGRRLWIQLRATDAGGTVVWESGAWDPATGVLSDGDAPAKIYRSEPGIWNRNGTAGCDVEDAGGDPIFHFVLNDCIRLDNRIPPAGFTGGADLELRPVGYVYPETFPGSGILVHWDDTSYALDLPPTAHSPVTVRARLLYQTSSKEYVEFLRDQAVANGFPPDCIERDGQPPMVSSRGQYLYDLWTSYGRSAPFEMDAAVGTVYLLLFRGDFETGDTSQWSVSVP